MLDENVFNRLTTLDPRFEKLKKINLQKKELIRLELGLTNRYTDSVTLKQLTKNQNPIYDPYLMDDKRYAKKPRRKYLDDGYEGDLLAEKIYKNLPVSAKKRIKLNNKKSSKIKRGQLGELSPDEVVKEIQLKMHCPDQKVPPEENTTLRRNSSHKKLPEVEEIINKNKRMPMRKKKK